MGSDKRTIKDKKDEIRKAHPEYSKKQVRQSARNYEMKTGGTVFSKSSMKHK